MKSIHIRDVPDETVEALKQLARMHNRSLQGELRQIMKQASRLAPSQPLVPLKLNQTATGNSASWNRETIYQNGNR